MISDESKYYYNFLNELVTMYKAYDASFEKHMVDLPITESIMGLLDLKHVEISDLEEFIVKEKVKIESSINIRNGFIFQQPVIILVLYYFTKHRTFLRDNWPLSNDILKQIYSSTGTSYERY